MSVTEDFVRQILKQLTHQLQNELIDAAEKKTGVETITEADCFSHMTLRTDPQDPNSFEILWDDELLVDLYIKKDDYLKDDPKYQITLSKFKD